MLRWSWRMTEDSLSWSNEYYFPSIIRPQIKENWIQNRVGHSSYPVRVKTVNFMAFQVLREYKKNYFAPVFDQCLSASTKSTSGLHVAIFHSHFILTFNYPPCPLNNRRIRPKTNICWVELNIPTLYWGDS